MGAGGFVVGLAVEGEVDAAEQLGWGGGGGVVGRGRGGRGMLGSEGEPQQEFC